MKSFSTLNEKFVSSWYNICSSNFLCIKFLISCNVTFLSMCISFFSEVVGNSDLVFEATSRPGFLNLGAIDT